MAEPGVAAAGPGRAESGGGADVAGAHPLLPQGENGVDSRVIRVGTRRSQVGSGRAGVRFRPGTRFVPGGGGTACFSGLRNGQSFLSSCVLTPAVELREEVCKAVPSELRRRSALLALPRCRGWGRRRGSLPRLVGTMQPAKSVQLLKGKPPND